MDANLCREHVTGLLAEESALLGRLATLLEDEHVYLSGSNVEALEQATDARQRCMGNLMRIEDERRALCRMCGYDSDLTGLEALLKWCDPSRTLQARWAECATRAATCRTLNDRNGLIVASRLKRVEGLLNIITGRNQTPATYGRQAAYATASAGRMVVSQA